MVQAGRGVFGPVGGLDHDERRLAVAGAVRGFGERQFAYAGFALHQRPGTGLAPCHQVGAHVTEHGGATREAQLGGTDHWPGRGPGSLDEVDLDHGRSGVRSDRVASQCGRLAVRQRDLARQLAGSQQIGGAIVHDRVIGGREEVGGRPVRHGQAFADGDGRPAGLPADGEEFAHDGPLAL